uniref:Uncharacterized protein n=1 Tax=Aegilops tauschii subsp. strangulata TaxID=200361 RepID=A0A453T151_AEGTS
TLSLSSRCSRIPPLSRCSPTSATTLPLLPPLDLPSPSLPGPASPSSRRLLCDCAHLHHGGGLASSNDEADRPRSRS